jgi:anti-sigma factor RsiW
MSEKENTGAAAARGCDRAEEFVTYLYGEAEPAEARAFRRHLEACAVCRDELAALGVVREGLGLWRAEALGTVPSLDIGAALADVPAPREAAGRRRSAAAAFREFFSLAPLWLRAGAFAAALAFCALAALTLSRGVVGRGTNVADSDATGGGARAVREQAPAPVQTGCTAEQVEAVVAQRVAEAKAQFEAQRAAQVFNVSDEPGEARPRTPPGSAPRRKRATRRAARGDEELLAEDTLPRLSDLLDGSY